MRTAAAPVVVTAVLWALTGCTSSEPAPPADTASPTPAAAPGPDDTCDLTSPSPSCAAWTVGPVAPPLAADGELVVASSGRELHAYATSDGQELWRFAPEADSLLGGAQVVGAGVLVTTTTPTAGEGVPVGSTCLLAPVDGRQVWCTAGLAAKVPATGDVVPLTLDSQVVVLDAATGTELWRRPTTGLIGPTFDDGEALVGDDGGVALVDAADGTVRWELELDRADMAPGSGPGELAAGSALVTVPSGRLVVDRATGEVTAEATALPDGSLGVAEGTMVSWLPDSSVSGVAPTGETTWTQAGRPLPARGGTALLVGAESEGREFVALLDPTTGQPTWQVPADAEATAVLADDTTVAIVRSGSVTVHDRSTGEVLLRLTAPDPTVVSLSPLVVATADQLSIITTG